MSIESRENDLSKSLAELGEMIERNVARIATLEAERDAARADLARKQRCIDAALQDYECDRGVHSMVSVLRPEATVKGEPVSPADELPEPSGDKALRLAMGIIGVLLTSGTNRVDGSLLEPHKRQELKAIASEARGGAE